MNVRYRRRVMPVVDTSMEGQRAVRWQAEAESDEDGEVQQRSFIRSTADAVKEGTAAVSTSMEEWAAQYEDWKRQAEALPQASLCDEHTVTAEVLRQVEESIQEKARAERPEGVGSGHALRDSLWRTLELGSRTWNSTGVRSSNCGGCGFHVFRGGAKTVTPIPPCATCGVWLHTGGECYAKHMKEHFSDCLLYTSPSPRDRNVSRMPSSA